MPNFHPLWTSWWGVPNKGIKTCYRFSIRRRRGVSEAASISSKLFCLKSKKHTNQEYHKRDLKKILFLIAYRDLKQYRSAYAALFLFCLANSIWQVIDLISQNIKLVLLNISYSNHSKQSSQARYRSQYGLNFFDEMKFMNFTCV